MSEIQQSIFDYIRQSFKIDKPIRLIELFCGYGSQFMAMKRLGADVESWAAIDIDKYAIDSYNAIHGTSYIPMDIANVGGWQLNIKDRDKYAYIMTYSSPCQDISRAGQQAGFEEDSETRSSLLWQVKRILLELKELNSLPDVLQFENVAAIADEKNKRGLRKWLDFLESIGYTSYSKIINTYDCCLPQNRERMIVVSLLGDYNYKFGRELPLRYCIENFYEDMTEEDAMQYVVKSEKAHDLLVKLDEEGKLEVN